MKKAFFSLSPFLMIGAIAILFNLKKDTYSPLPFGKSTSDIASMASKNDFSRFLNQFPKVSLPYTISAEYLQKHMQAAIKMEEDAELAEHRALRNSRVRLDDPRRFLPASRYRMFSRSPVYLEPVARVETKQYIAVVYTASRGFGWEYLDYEIAVFNKAGTLISDQEIASTSPMELKAATVDRQLNVLVQTFRVNWENDFDENGTDGNDITGLTLETAETIDLTRPDEELRDYKPDEKTEQPESESLGAVTH